MSETPDEEQLAKDFERTNAPGARSAAEQRKVRQAQEQREQALADERRQSLARGFQNGSHR